MIRIFAKNCSRFDANPRSRWMRIAVHAACESLFTIDANMQLQHYLANGSCIQADS